MAAGAFRSSGTQHHFSDLPHRRPLRWGAVFHLGTESVVDLFRGPPTATSALIKMKSAPEICFDHGASHSRVPAFRSCSTINAPRMFGRLSACGVDDREMDSIAARVVRKPWVVLGTVIVPLR